MTIPALPAPIFHVSEKMDIFKTKQNLIESNTITQKCYRVAYLIFSIIVFPVGIARAIVFIAKQIIPKLMVPAITIFNTKNNGIVPLSDVIVQADMLREKFIANPLNNSKQVTLQTADEINLDACIIESSHQKATSPEQQKWLIFFTGNAGCYEFSLDDLKGTSEMAGVNVLAANYRGVMRSQGSPTCSQDLVLDGEAQVQFLLSQGVTPENILLHGWSLGGAVAAEVASNHPGMHLFSDRSFSDISAVLKAWISNTLGYVGGKIADKASWRFDSIKNFQKIQGHKIIFHSKEDAVIRYQASLYKGLKEVQMTAADRKLKSERSIAKAAFKNVKNNSTNKTKKFKDYNQDYKPKNDQRLLFTSKNLTRAEIIKEHGHDIHCRPLNETGYYLKYIETIQYVLNIELPENKPTFSSSQSILQQVKACFNGFFKYA